MRRILVLGVALLAARAAAADDLTVFAAASLREAFDDLGRNLEARIPGTRVRMSYAGSQELRTQIEQGAKPDVFAAADPRHIAALEKGGFVAGSKVFVRNEPVIAVPRGNPAGIAGLADLPKARRLVIGVPEVPIGSYTLQILDKASARLGKDFKDRVLARVVSRELNVRQVLAKVILGEADAAIVYRTDALAGKAAVEVVDIAPEFNLVADYPIAVLRSAPQPRLAQAFVDLVLSGDGQKRLAAAGFILPK